jgi:uncharacterized protein YecE (DUF72 family)
LHVGTSSWSTTDWYGVFYPPDIQPGDFITHYAKQFDTVEIDATFYRQPGKEMVDGWNKRTPDDFIFAAKVPQLITHEKYLEDCQQEMTNFVKTMARLGDKLGPLVFQFSYFPKKKDEHEYKTGDDFRQRLKKFLPTLPKEFRFTVEIRNSNWLGEELLGLLRKHNVALTVACYYTMPALDQLMKQFDLVTSDFSYIRFLGNHKHMDSLIDRLMQESNKEKHWNELIVDRTAEMERWITAIRELVDRKIDVFAYFNNHYAGFAPGSIKLFRELWQKSREGQSKTPKSEPKRRKP